MSPRLLQPRRGPAQGSVGGAAATATTSPRSIRAPAATSSPEMVGVPPPGADRVPTPAARSPAPPPPLPYRVSLLDAFKFAGPAPEVINGRLAMAFLPVVASLEASTGLSARALGEQLLRGPAALADQPGTLGLAAFAAVIIAASLAPIRVGAIAEAVGPFTPTAERVNGRAAMLGWAALLWLEAQAGGVPFF